MDDGIEIAHGWRPGILGEVVAMHARSYARDWGFGPHFEAGVAAGMAEFLARYDPDTCRTFRAQSPTGHLVGSLTIDGGGVDGTRLHWFILDEAARGRGIGSALMQAAMAFVEEAALGPVWLTSFRGLEPARALYERHGFRLVLEQPSTGWGTPVMEQRFERP